MDHTMIAEYLGTMIVPVITGLCLCLGYVLKHWVADAENKYIPTACAVMGLLLAIWINWPGITPAVLLQGILSGLASTGLHQAVTQIWGKTEVKTKE